MTRTKSHWRIAAWSALAVVLLTAGWLSSRVVLGEHVLGKGFAIVAAKAAQDPSQIESRQFADRVLRRIETQDARLAAFNEEQGRLAIDVNVASNGDVWLNYSFGGYSLGEFDVARWSFVHGATETAEIQARNEVVYTAIVAELELAGWCLPES